MLDCARAVFEVEVLGVCKMRYARKAHLMASMTSCSLSAFIVAMEITQSDISINKPSLSKYAGTMGIFKQHLEEPYFLELKPTGNSCVSVSVKGSRVIGRVCVPIY